MLVYKHGNLRQFHANINTQSDMSKMTCFMYPHANMVTAQEFPEKLTVTNTDDPRNGFLFRHVRVLRCSALWSSNDACVHQNPSTHQNKQPIWAHLAAFGKQSSNPWTTMNLHFEHQNLGSDFDYPSILAPFLDGSPAHSTASHLPCNFERYKRFAGNAAPARSVISENHAGTLKPPVATTMEHD